MPSSSSNVVTRFAPSPTGFLHIGGARTALFNWAYAKAKGGVMRLRIEDTDRERSTEAAIEAIIEGLTWLGLDWEGDIVYQHTRADRHREAADVLLARGLAYRCYATPEELAEMREKARAEGRPPRYDGRWRDRDPSDAPPCVPSAIRFRAPADGETLIEDQVQGDVTFPNKDLDDLIILRSDGSPTYNFSVVVDDHDMGVTHIVRGVDHLTNAARQAQIYRALGWAVPVMAHVPLIHGADGQKLSKRHGALGVDAYREMGYLPEAMRNYLARLGWSHGDDEIFSTEDLVSWFDLSGIGKSPARLDLVKLENLNGHYLRTMDGPAVLAALEEALPSLPGGPDFQDKLTETKRNRLAQAVDGLKERAKTLVDLMDNARFLVDDRPLTLEDKAAALLDGDGRRVIAGLFEQLAAIDDWSIETLEASVRTFAETHDLKLGKAAQPLRAALTGRTTSPGIFDVLAVLGRDESLARLRDQIGENSKD